MHSTVISSAWIHHQADKFFFMLSLVLYKIINVNIKYEDLKKLFYDKLVKYGASAELAEESATLFADNTLDGVYSHGINRFPRVISYIKDGYIDLDAKPELVESFGAIERWDGKMGMGNTNAKFLMNRAMELAREHGIGAVAVKNTNHWMRGGSYGWQAADNGMIAICWTNTNAIMPPWGGKTPKIGNNPFVIAIPRENGEHVVVDTAMSQFAYGKLQTLRLQGKELPVDGGYDENGNITRDPGKIEKTRRILPMGFWKGSSLAIALDLVAALASGGNSTKEIAAKPAEIAVSQVFIAIDNERMNAKEFSEQLIDETLAFVESSEPIEGPVRYPGKGSLDYRRRQSENGIEVSDEIYQTILAF